MAESYLSDAELNALSGTSDAEQEVLFVTTGESPYYTSFYKMLYRLLNVARRAGDLRVYKDGDLTYGVRAGKFFNGDTAVSYVASAANALTNNATNYIYLTAAGALTINTTGFPAPSLTPHIPLATILTAAGAYAHSDITDVRGRAFLAVADGVSAATQQDLTPNLLLTGADDADGTGACTIQARDGGNNNLAQRFLVRTWIADAEYSEPDPQTGFTVTTGELMRLIEAQADHDVISDATGLILMDINIGAPKAVYVMAEIDGRIYSSGVINITGP